MSPSKTTATSKRSRLAQSAATSILALSALSGSILFSGTDVHAQAAPPFGPSLPGMAKNIFYFSPWGGQQDGDNSFPVYHVPDTSLPGIVSYNIYDINTSPNQPLDFDLFLYTTAPQFVGAGQTLQSIEFSAEFDPSEYKFNAFAANPNFIANCPQVPGVGAPVGILQCNFNAGFSVANGGAGVFAAPVKLGTFEGVTVNPGLIPHDGVDDFKLTLAALVDNGIPPANQVPNVSGQFQDVELQFVPSPLPMLGALAALGSVRRARKLSLHLKNFSRD